MGIGNIHRPMLDERKAAILRAVVEEYIETAQPVGSGHVAPAVNVSSATVRNELATLEQEGYLQQPHTSAGRVPTEKGYRYFVDSLTGPGTLGASQVQQVRSFFATAHGELEQMLHQTSRLLSAVTAHLSRHLGGQSIAALNGYLAPASGDKRTDKLAARVVTALAGTPDTEP